MDVKGFGKLFGSLNELTGPQLKELLSALKSLDARMQALGAIETRRGEPDACPYCRAGTDDALGLGAKRGPADAMRDLSADFFLEDGSIHRQVFTRSCWTCFPTIRARAGVSVRRSDSTR